MQDADVGSLVVSEFKTHHDFAGKLEHMIPVKSNIDSGGGGSAMAAGMEIVAEGAGTAHDVLTGVRFSQTGTDGTLMSVLRFDNNTSFGVKAITAAASLSGTMYQLPVDVAGTIFFVNAFDQTGT